MKEKQNDKKICQGCRYYSQHYSKRDTKYDAVCCGHCLNYNNKKMIPLENCEFWEDIAVKKDERKKSIKETLEFMSEQLDEIAMILKDDAE